MTKNRVGPSAVALALLFVGIIRAQDQADPAMLTLTESAGNYVLTVPLSRLTLTIPKGGLVPQPPSVGGAPAANSNYFNFTHKDRALNASGWFSPWRSRHHQRSHGGQLGGGRNVDRRPPVADVGSFGRPARRTEGVPQDDDRVCERGRYREAALDANHRVHEGPVRAAIQRPIRTSVLEAVPR